MQMVFENRQDFDEVRVYLERNFYTYSAQYKDGKYFIKIEY
jgi:hypothetical protein